MANLSLSCLGPFQATLGGKPITSFKSNKVRALLIYLAVEADRPHRREVLASLLWTDWPDREALSNLRCTLSNLRQAIGDRAAAPPFLHITREDLQFNTTSDHLLDVTAFLAGTESTLDTAEGPQDLSGVQESITHYRGEFLEGFSLRDSNAFDEWVLLKRQQFGQRLLTALRYLSAFYEQRGEYALAQAYARRQIEREPWDEVAHRQLMRTFALSGQRNTALSQYETCCQLLIKELGVEPTQETKRLYEQILDGHLAAVEPFRVAPSAPPVKLPPISRRRDSSS